MVKQSGYRTRFELLEQAGLDGSCLCNRGNAGLRALVYNTHR
jgi:hypothetical protein